MNVMLTALVLDSVFNGLPDISGAEFARLLLISTVSMVIMYIVGFLFAPPFRKNKSRASIIESLIAAPNTMFIAAPIVRELYGGTAMFYLIITCIPFNVLLYTYRGVARRAWRERQAQYARYHHAAAHRVFRGAHSCSFPHQGARAYMRPVLCRRRGYGADVDDSHRRVAGAVRIRDAFANPLTYFASFVRLIVCPIVIWLARVRS